jgi:dienelactone hydrolase
LTVANVVEVLTLDPQGSLLRAEVPSQGIAYERVRGEPVAGREPTTSERIPAVPAPPAAPGPGSPRDQAAVPSRRLYEERVVTFVAGDTHLDGLLALPRGGQPIPYPAVLLVHDAGPLDRDASIGPNHPFLDLARGLAVMGVASFRYDKRTLAAPRTIAPVRGTVEEEVIADAVAALEALRSQAEIDGRAIAIAGHGLGGSLAATIARRSGRAAGLVVLAGSPRPLDALVRDELVFLGASGATGPALQELDSLMAGTLPPDRLVLGMSAHYLSDYRARDLAGDFLAFRGPVLFLQGGKDYQVARADLDLWRERMEIGGKRNATFRFFPGLGHLFLPIAGEPSVAALLAPGSVDPEVIEEIARFVHDLR